ncbi:protein-glutamate methylesterase/protein-glutamine glutaminase [Acetivibrio straminisolvens]|jgi:two-component system chemotaxis response regulator CheB|uniref:Protein-glutamate methylesterase/protein-glutamine glutaminase n=1 Tax=Acetivibrio straminisolvens JCM 21531 TaxID=1294263 RepID=W4V855_9FIRM|nr:chemotaxis response regulator protein-glutamate methylesterase [Acetivibrio straminisolvens]GAE88993.1 chemotaxis response regulator protein-glutamate methylesterase CheB [Acetivibrio straminisolvens JCM 21531]
MIWNLKQKITVLVVDDSAFMRKVISDILNSDEEIKVIDTAKNGLEAIEKAQKLKPDVITLDLKMPIMDGLECLRKLNETMRIPVIMLSSITKEGAEATIQALAEGAMDFVAKPENIFDMKEERIKNEIIEKVKIAKNYKCLQCDKKKTGNVIKVDTTKSKIQNLVVIGTSTGGPRALQDVLPLFPANVDAAFLIVQHMPGGFTKSLAERLDSISNVKVKEAEDNEILENSHVYIAPGDFHMLLEKKGNDLFKIKLSKDPPLGGHRPSVDVMMESVSDTGFKNIVAVIMTGMGRDGSEGIRKLKSVNKAHIIAQDESSCVVFGMPRVAISTGAVDVVVPLKEIANEIMKIVGVHE